jgi:cell division protein FtsB
MGFFGTKKTESEENGAAMTPAPAAVPAPAAQKAKAAAAPEGSSPRYGIDNAIQLMRSLPTDKNIDLVITVLKTTLESLNISVAEIVRDAARREKDIEGRVTALKAEIATLEKEMEQRVTEIMRLEAAHSETTRVKDYLERDEVSVDVESHHG